MEFDHPFSFLGYNKIEPSKRLPHCSVASLSRWFASSSHGLESYVRMCTRAALYASSRLMNIALLLLRARSCSGCMEQPQPASSRNGSSRPMTWFMLSTCRPKHVKPHALHHLAVRLHQPTCQKRWPPPAASLLWSAATAGHAASRIPGCSFASTGARRHMFARASTPITVGCPVNTRWVRALGGWR